MTPVASDSDLVIVNGDCPTVTGASPLAPPAGISVVVQFAVLCIVDEAAPAPIFTMNQTLPVTCAVLLPRAHVSVEPAVVPEFVPPRLWLTSVQFGGTVSVIVKAVEFTTV